MRTLRPTRPRPLKPAPDSFRPSFLAFRELYHLEAFLSKLDNLRTGGAEDSWRKETPWSRLVLSCEDVSSSIEWVPGWAGWLSPKG